VADERIKAVLYNSLGQVVKTTWYAGTYEKVIEGSVTKHYYYINSPDGPVALAIGEGAGTPVIYYLCKDHLGSITGIMENDGDMLEEYSYDAWGTRRNPVDWSYSNVSAPTYTQHGFTGHEHLDMFELIHMNGRVYDPEIARFLSPDPVIQDPYSIFSYNRYSYCLNNPLKYTDPSGYKEAEIEPELIWTNPGWLKYADPTHQNNYFDYLESLGGGGGGSSGGINYGKPGEGENGAGLGSVYYDHISGTYRFTTDGNRELTREQLILYFKLLMNPQSTGGDLTSSFNNYISSTQQRFTGVGDIIDKTLSGPSAYAAKLYYFYQVNMHDKSLNPKDDAQSPFYRGGYYNGRYMKAEDFGNYNYGVAARSLGISLGDALWGAGAATFIIKGSSHTWWNVLGLFDEWNDSKMIIRGYLQLDKK